MTGERITTGEYVYLQLINDIRSGLYKPNEKLPSENELADQYKCSRNTVRGALNKLTTLGMVETYQGKGTFVKESDFNMQIENLVPQFFRESHDYLSIMHLWAAIESESASLACQRISYLQIQELESLVLDMEQHKDDLEYYSERDALFHTLIAEASGNNLLITLIQMVRAVLNDVMNEFITEFGNYESIDSHRKILEFIKTMDSKEAHSQMHKHTSSAIIRYSNINRSK